VSLRFCVFAFTLWSAFSITSASQQPDTHPARIISLIPATTEMLFAIGAAPQVVAVGSFDAHPPEVQSLPRVGALLDPDVERILSLKPDLVIVYGTQLDLRQQLERAGIQQFSYKHGGLAGVTATIRALGARIGRVQEAERVATDIESRLTSIRRRMAGRPRPKTVLVFGRDRMSLQGIFASGGVGFLNDMLQTAGGDNVFADVKRESVQATSELILARSPDVILELRSSIDPDQAAAERAVWDTLAAVPAVRTGRVHMLADPSLMVPGPRVAHATELIAGALHSRSRGEGGGRGDGFNAELAENAKKRFEKPFASSALKSSLRPQPTSASEGR
jgi:iron complex transport system substrate-binding protein